MDRWGWVLPVLGYALLAGLLFGPSWGWERLPYSVDMAQCLPMEQMVVDAWQQGVLPLWNRYWAGGQPLFGWAPIFYPLNGLFLLLPIPLAFTFSYALHFTLAASLACGYARHWGLSRTGATLAGLAFAFGGQLTVRIFGGQPNSLWSATWIPLILWWADLALARRSLGWALAAGLVLGMQILVAWPQLSSYLVLVLAACTLWRAWQSWRGSDTAGRLREALHTLALGALIIAAGLLVGAAYLLPARLSVEGSLRQGGLAYGSATAGSLPPHHLLTFVMPYLFGSELEGDYWGYFLGSSNWTDTCAYVGPLVLGLALAGLVWRWREPALRLWAGIALGSLVMAMGRFTPLYRLAYHLIPGTDLFRNPARWLAFTLLGTGLLAGWGLDALYLGPARRRRRAMFAAFGAALALALGWAALHWGQALLVGVGERLAQHLYEAASWQHVRPLDYSLSLVQRIVPALAGSLVRPLALCLAAGALLAVGRWRPRWQHLARLAWVVLVAWDLVSFASPFVQPRELSELLSPTQQEFLGLIQEDPEPTRLYASHGALPLNLGPLFGYEDIQSDSMMTVAPCWELTHPAERADPDLDRAFQRALFPLPTPNVRRLLNLKYLLLDDAPDTLPPGPGWTALASAPVAVRRVDRARGDAPRIESREVTLYRAEPGAYLPRAWAVPQAQTVPAGEILDALEAAAFDPQAVVLLAGEGDATLGSGWPEGGKSRVEVVEQPPNRLHVEADLPGPGYLVVSACYFPGWHARVDGKPAPLLRANHALMAVPVPLGKHRVELWYWPPGLTAGLTLSGCTLVILALWTLCRRLSKRRGSHP